MSRNSGPAFDSHVHFQIASGSFPEDMSTWRGCSCATGEEDWEQTLAVTIKLPGAVPYLGVHPWFINGRLEDVLTRLDLQLTAHPEAGVGEIGLDSFRAQVPVETQRVWFREQMQIAVSLRRPVSIHCVRCWGPLIDELSTLPSPLPPFFVHGFNGSAELLERILALGGLVSFSPFSLRGKSGRSAGNLAAVSEDRYLLDTDFPYAEGQHLSEYPRILSSLFESAAELRNEPVNNVINTVGRNLKPFLGGAV